MSRMGSREISNVVIKDITTKKPVLYLETLTVSSMEQTADAVYARGGAGNPKRIMWESNKEVMYNMTDALISPEGLSLLFGTEVVKGSKPRHYKEVKTLDADAKITLDHEPAPNTDIFIFQTTNGDDIGTEVTSEDYTITDSEITFTGLTEGDNVIVDYYYTADTTSLEITVDKFSGYYTLEADTLFRRESDGKDLPATYTMPKIKFASNVSIENAATGDPATFDFNAECFPNSDNKMVIIDVVEEE